MVKRRKSISWIRLIRIGPPPASRPPRRSLEIVGRLVRGPDRRYPDDVPDPSLAEQRFQRLDLQVMATMMTDQRFDAALAHFRDQGGRGLDRIGNRLLDQDINAAPGAFDAGLGMKLIGRGDDHGLGPRFVEQLTVIREDPRLGVFGGNPIDIHVGDTDQIIVVTPGEFGEMLASDQPRADHADGDVLHVMRPVRDWPVSSCRATGAQAGVGSPQRPRRSVPASQAPAWASRR